MVDDGEYELPPDIDGTMESMASQINFVCLTLIECTEFQPNIDLSNCQVLSTAVKCCFSFKTSGSSVPVLSVQYRRYVNSPTIVLMLLVLVIVLVDDPKNESW